MNNKNDSIEKYIFDFVYRAAVNDATMQKAYLGSKEDILNNDSAKKNLWNYIHTILTKDQIDEKICDFDIIAGQLRNDFGGDKNFRFGNIQKLINMTAKYFFISTYADPDKRKRFKHCHCPMDSKMIHDVSQKYKTLIKDVPSLKMEKNEYFTFNGRPTRDWANVSWSRIDFELTNDETSRIVYDKYQKMVKILAEKKNAMPIEYDYIEWS